jgi:hypothetical protein
MNAGEVERQLRSESQEAGKRQGVFWPELISAKDLLALPPDPTRWIWDWTLPVGGCSILVAKPKIGKTTLAANLSLAVCRGYPFLGRPTQKNPVAFLSLDASLPEIAETFTQLGLKPDDALYLHAGSAPGEPIPWIMERIKEKGVRFVVIDTLQRLFRFKDVNDYAQVVNSMEPLLEEARGQNVHVLLTHHAKKDAGDDLDAAIGSTAIRGMAYTYLHLKRLPDSERRILRSDQRNGKNFPECALGFNKDGWLEVFGSRDDAEIEEVKPKIITALETAEAELTEKEILKAVPARAVIVSKAIRQMFKAGQLSRTGKGIKRNPFRYSLSYSLPLEEAEKGKKAGRESKNPENPLPVLNKFSIPENREENGKRIRKTEGAGRESEEGWEEV